MRPFSRTTFLLLFAFAPLAMFAQAEPTLDEWIKKYPDRNAVQLRDDETILIDISKDSLEITQDVYNETLYLNDKAHMFNLGKVYYSYFSRLEDMEAKTLVPNGTKFKTMKVEHFEETGETSASVFFDDSKSKTFVYPGLQKGARSVLTYKKKIIEPQLLSMFYFGSGIPVASSKLVIRTHRNVKIGYKLFNTENIKVDYSTQEKGKYIEHTWEAKDVNSFLDEPGTPSPRYYLPHIVYYIDSYTANGKETKVLSKLDDLYKWNYSFVTKIINENDPGIKSLTDSIIATAKTDSEKAKRIYYWVQEQIKYVAFEDGFRGFTPHSPSVVCSKRYGDCKDMASLLHGMLRMAGLKSHLVWIGSRELPYKYSEIHTPAVDDHMIAAVDLGNDSLVFLDATSPYTPFGMPSAFIQGKEGLVAIDATNYKVKMVPTVKMETNMLIDSTSLVLDGKRITGKGSLTLTGYNKANNTYGLEGRRKEDLDRIMNSFLEKGNNKYKTVSYNISNITDKDKPLIFDYNFTLDDYVTTVGNELYINLVLDKGMMGATIDTVKYSLPRESDFCHRSVKVTTLEIPQGYTVEHLPKNSKYDHPYFGYSAEYTRSGNKITITSVLYINHLLLKKESFSAWNSMIRQMSNTYRESLILKKS